MAKNTDKLEAALKKIADWKPVEDQRNYYDVVAEFQRIAREALEDKDQSVFVLSGHVLVQQ